MTTPILFRGGEDIDFQVIGGGRVDSASTIRGIYWSTTSTHYRTSYARGAIVINSNSQDSNANTWFIRAPFAAQSEFWFSARLGHGSISGQALTTSAGGAPRVISFEDSGTRRLQIRMVGTSAGAPATGSNWQVETVTAAGSVTQIGSTWSAGLSDNPSTPHKIDIYVRYGTSGQIKVFINSVQVYNFSGDVTTDSATTLSSVTMGSVCCCTNNAAVSTTRWSEVIVSLNDTRNISLLTKIPAAAGNTLNWQTAPTGRDVTDDNTGGTRGTQQISANNIVFRYVPMNSGVHGLIEWVAFQISSGGASGSFVAGIYSTNANNTAPLNLLCTSNTVTGTGTNTTMLFTFASPIVLSQNTSFWIGIYCPVNTTFYSGNGNLDRVLSGQSGLPSTISASVGSQGTSGGSEIAASRIARQEAPTTVEVAVSSTDTAGNIIQFIPGFDLNVSGLKIVEVTPVASVVRGSSGPSKLAMGLRRSSTDYWGTDQTLSDDYTTISQAWDQNPATSADWSYADIANDGTFQFGYRAAT